MERSLGGSDTIHEATTRVVPNDVLGWLTVIDWMEQVAQERRGPRIYFGSEIPSIKSVRYNASLTTRLTAANAALS